MGFFIHIQQQQITEEGDLGKAGQTCALALNLPFYHLPGPHHKTTLCTGEEWGAGGGAQVCTWAGLGTQLQPKGAHVSQTHHTQPSCSGAQSDGRGDEAELPCLRPTWAEPLEL